MKINPEDYEEVTKEDIISKMKAVPFLDAFYSEKNKLIIVIWIDTIKRFTKVVQCIEELPNGKFLQRKGIDPVPELTKLAKKEMN